MTPKEIERWKIANRPECAVYFVYSRGFIKIGWSESWRARIHTLQVANPEPIEVLLVIGRPKIFERTMHKQFSQFRSHGEWFRDCPEIRSYIEGRLEECWHRAGRPK